MIKEIKINMLKIHFIDTVKNLPQHHGDFYTSFHKFYNSDLVKFCQVVYITNLFVIYLSEIKSIGDYSELSDEFIIKTMSVKNVHNFKVIIK